MKRCIWQLVMILAVALSLASLAAIPAAPPLLPRRPASFAQSYRLLLERNIFDASRTGYVYHTFSSTGPSVQQNMLTLTGVVYEDGAYAAFVEDNRTNSTTKYKVGDTVDGRKIAAVGMDYVDLAAGGRTIHVFLGQNLSGVSPLATTNPTTEPSPGNDVIERLRQRRLQELHQ